MLCSEKKFKSLVDGSPAPSILVPFGRPMNSLSILCCSESLFYFMLWEPEAFFDFAICKPEGFFDPIGVLANDTWLWINRMGDGQDKRAEYYHESAEDLRQQILFFGRDLQMLVNLV